MIGKRKLSETEIQRIYETYKDLVFRIAMIRLMNEQDAYDVVQTVFLKIIDHAQIFQDTEYEKRWIIRVTCNTCYSILRKPWRKHKDYIEEIQKEFYENDIENFCILDAVLQLPDKYKNVVYLYYYEGYKYREIAEILKEKESTVKMRMKRAKEILKKELEE